MVCAESSAVNLVLPVSVCEEMIAVSIVVTEVLVLIACLILSLCISLCCHYCLLDESHILVGIKDIDSVLYLTYGHIAVVVDLRSAALTAFLGSDDDDTVRST